jgi:hypothetical protein
MELGFEHRLSYHADFQLYLPFQTGRICWTSWRCHFAYACDLVSPDFASINVNRFVHLQHDFCVGKSAKLVNSAWSQ